MPPRQILHYYYATVLLKLANDILPKNPLTNGYIPLTRGFFIIINRYSST